VLGFHTYDIEPGSTSNGWEERRPLNVSDISWLSAVMSPNSARVVDPFVTNATPWWLSPSGQCQNNLEDGDVIEGLPNPRFSRSS